MRKLDRLLSKHWTASGTVRLSATNGLIFFQRQNFQIFYKFITPLKLFLHQSHFLHLFICSKMLQKQRKSPKICSAIITSHFLQCTMDAYAVAETNKKGMHKSIAIALNKVSQKCPGESEVIDEGAQCKYEVLKCSRWSGKFCAIKPDRHVIL